MNNAYGKCSHTKYDGCGPCVHDAWVRGVRDAVRVLRDYETETAQHRAGVTGTCNPFDGDRCDIVAALRVVAQRLADDAEQSWEQINR